MKTSFTNLSVGKPTVVTREVETMGGEDASLLFDYNNNPTVQNATIHFRD